MKWQATILVLGFAGLLQHRSEVERRYEIIERREKFTCPPVERNFYEGRSENQVPRVRPKHRVSRQAARPASLARRESEMRQLSESPVSPSRADQPSGSTGTGEGD